MNPDVILPLIDRAGMDCAVCCLQMLVPGQADLIRAAALKMAPTHARSGLWPAQVQRIARKVGLVLARRNVPPLPDEGCGIVWLQLRTGGRHFVVLWDDKVVNPADGQVWRADAYFANKGKPLAILVEA